MAEFKAHKVVSALPSTLEADTVYFVRTGAGFDLFVSDTTGNIAYAVNADTLDGLDSTDFQRVYSDFGGITDLNLAPIGWIQGDSADITANKPPVISDRPFIMLTTESSVGDKWQLFFISDYIYRRLYRGDISSWGSWNVNNPFTEVDKTKLDSVDFNASDDQTPLEIKTAYESNADTNAFTDAEKSKLASLLNQTPLDIKTAYESNADTNAFTDAEKSKLAGVEAGATGDQTKAEIDALGINAATVDGLNGDQFIRSDVNDTFAGDLEATYTKGLRFGSPNQTDGNDGVIAAGKFASGLNIVGTQTVAGQGREVRIWGNLETNGRIDGRDVAADGAKLDSIEAGATADQTKADIDALNINADTVDGIHGTQFLRNDQSGTINGELTATKFRCSSINGGGEAFQVGNDAWIGDVNIANGFAVKGTLNPDRGYISFGNQHGQVLGRAGTGPLTWGDQTIWHAGNDGSGSGLDADTVDGLQGSQFLRNDLSGQTQQMQGNLQALGSCYAASGFTTGWAQPFHATYWNYADANDGKIGARLFGSGLNIVGVATEGNGIREIRTFGNLINGGNIECAGTLRFPQGTDNSSDDGTIKSVSGGILEIRGNHSPAAGGQYTKVYGQFDIAGNANTYGNHIVSTDLIVYGTFSNPSDRKLKENIQPVEAGITDKLNPVSFDWKKTGKGDFGFIAQEIEEVLPSIVSDVKDGQSDETVKAYTPLQIIPFLVRDLQETRETVKAQQAQIDELRAMVEALVSGAT